MQHGSTSTFIKSPPHPLIYASLEPCYSSHAIKRIDLHKPKARYTIGRGPLNDFILDNSGQIDWTHCTLLLNDDGVVCIEENHTTNGIWVNDRRLSPGETCALEDGVSVRFGMCVLEPCSKREINFGYIQGLDHSYIFRSFLSHTPPGLSASDQMTREQLEALDRRRAIIIEERARLEQELKEIEEESGRIIQSMPDVPLTKAANAEKLAQSRYERLARYLRDDYPEFFPKDVRDFRPQPWTIPVVGPEDTTVLHAMHRSFGAIPNGQPPPLEKDSRIHHFTRAVHHAEAPDWNHPEVTWGELQALNLSTPLNIPPSIIFWSLEHCQPVYMHPNFFACSRKGPYAHPYAISEYVFSDESAARYRAEIGLPPLESPYPLRPEDALFYRVKDQRSVPDEEELAGWVALLQKKGTPSPDSSPEPSSGDEEAPVAPVSTSSRRLRVSGVDFSTGGHPAAEGRTSSATSVDGSVPDEGTLERISPRHSPSPTPADAPTRLSSPKSSACADLGSSHPVASRPAKRRKTYHSPTESPTVAISIPIAPPDEAKGILRTSPEPLSTAAVHITALSGSSSVEPKPAAATPELESA